LHPAIKVIIGIAIVGISGFAIYKAYQYYKLKKEAIVKAKPKEEEPQSFDLSDEKEDWASAILQED